MDCSSFLGIMWDYFDWVTKEERKEIERKVRLELNEWKYQELVVLSQLLDEIVEEVRLDTTELIKAAGESKP